MSRISEAHEELVFEWETLCSAWSDSKAAWQDSLSSQFEKRFVAPLESDFPQFLHALESLKDELKTAQRDLR
jgi:hypothetical protein